VVIPPLRDKIDSFLYGGGPLYTPSEEEVLKGMDIERKIKQIRRNPPLRDKFKENN
jgi:hypothetical protein